VKVKESVPIADFGETRVAVHLSPPGLRAVRSGHPWLFDSGIVRRPESAADGALAVLFDSKRRFVGIGLYDPNSPIRVRVLHQGGQQQIDAAWLRKRIADSIDRRASLRDDPRTTGYRLVHGENDMLPGIVIDRYASTAVLKLDSSAWLPHLPLLQTCISDLTECDRIVLRMSRTLTSHCPPSIEDGMILSGSAVDEAIVFHENGIAFEAEPVTGQKTGFFLDQRDNRARVGRLAKGLDVLNVFAYTGGFSLYAARGGAVSVTSLDISKRALAASQRNVALNSDDAAISNTPHHIVAADAFAALAEFVRAGRRFDMVILDPPSFARRQTEVGRALAAYRRLAGLGIGVLDKGGMLVSASCSARVSTDDFFAVVTRAAVAAGRPLREIERTAHALDHPIGFPEGAYLKCLFARA
jgi:23S rRNA (cytosine1962-C5)-methyltransferase